MAVERFTDGAVWQAAAGYSRAVRSGLNIAVSGTTASGPDGSVVHPGDTFGQATEILRRCLTAVAALGGHPQDVVRTRVFLTPEASWRDAARAHRAVFADFPPANSMVFVSALVGEGLLVEIEMDAVVDEGRSTPPVAGAGTEGRQP